MKKGSLFFILVLMPLATLFADGSKRIMEGLSISSAILGQEVKYTVVLPSGYEHGNKKYPVVYLLHGLGDNESSWLEYGRIAQVADQAVAEKEIAPMIFVMPQGFRNYYVNDYAGIFRYEDMFVEELVPFIDNQYRTIADSKHRAVMGYSMGGFGALILPALHPDVFSVSVPLSISVRTDEQYMTEDASEWNEQWGRLFGGVGKIGQDRLTDHYKEYSPFHFFRQGDPKRFIDLRLFIDNGDDEHTLCRSNEELHILLRDLGIRHEYRVRDGGHEFSYWRSALPNALHFISDSFEGEPYRGDVVQQGKKKKYPKPDMMYKGNYVVVFPPGYDVASRRFPTVYLFGDMEDSRKQAIAGLAHQGMIEGTLPPLILVFLSENEKNLVDQIIPELEFGSNARSGYRFRALMGFEEGGVAALRYAMMPETFTSCTLFDAPIDTSMLRDALSVNKSVMKKTWLLISNTDTDLDYASNGYAHILLRDEDVYHEYRVVEGGRDVQVSNERLTEAFNFTSEKIHR